MHHATSWAVRPHMTADLCPPWTSLTHLIIPDAVQMMFLGIGLLALPSLVYLYKRENKRRDMIKHDTLEKPVILSAEELRRMGDRAPDFRYML